MCDKIKRKEYFQGLLNDSHEERVKYLNDNCSVADLENIACEYYYNIADRLRVKMIYVGGYDFGDDECDLLGDILFVRRNKLDAKFIWTDNYKKQFLELNEKVINGFNTAYDEAKAQFLVLKDRIKRNYSNIDGFNIEINLKPVILEANEDDYCLEERGEGIYFLLYNILPDYLWSDTVYHENKTNENPQRKYKNDGLNYDIEYFKKGNFNDSFICFAIHELLDNCRHFFSWYDILKINQIWIDVIVTHQYFNENVGKGNFWDEGIQSLSDNEAENIRQEYMSRMSKKMTGLPVEIFIDEMDSWENIGPFKRIKFQGNTADMPDFKKLYSMSIEEEPRVLVKDAQIDLTDKELQQVKDFVSKNKELLLSLAKGNIDLIDFLEKSGCRKEEDANGKK